jgi:tyrosyl-tRNA synthetase
MSEFNELLSRGVTNIIPDKPKLLKLLESGKKLNIYMGIDPTSTKIHLGHAVILKKLQKFSELGHNVTFLIGDFTALIGDSSDKESERPILTEKEIKNNFKTYKLQAKKFVDFSKVTVKYNSEWLNKLKFEDIIKLTQNYSVGDFIGRELIKKRLNSRKRVRLDEALYPVMQGYDSYFLDTDLQLGGADQTFNMQAGRILQKNLRGKESFILVVEYLIGTDGRKMSKSWGNAIWLDDTPNEIYGKVMSIADSLIKDYLHLATSLPIDKIAEYEKGLKDNPLEIKKSLAFAIVEELYSENLARSSQEFFESFVQRKGGSDKIPKLEIKNKSKKNLTHIELINAVLEISESKTAAKRLIVNGAVDVNGEKATDVNFNIKTGDIIKIGKKKIYKLEIS